MQSSRKLNIPETINTLLQSRYHPDHVDRDDAVKFLTDVMVATPAAHMRIVLPIACLMLDYPGWKAKVSADALVAHCLLRAPLIAAIDVQATAEFDPQIDFMHGVGLGFADRVGLRLCQCGDRA